MTEQHIAPASPEPPVIESASASTACQTNSSKTAYIITATVLLIVTLIFAGLAALALVGIETYYSDWNSSEYLEEEVYPDYAPDDDFFYDGLGTISA